MSGSYVYSSDLWPALITFGLIVFLGWYSWLRRAVPGAKPFLIGCLFALLWALGALLETSAVNLPDKLFWVKFQVVWQLPAVTALTCFALEYGGLSRWITRRNLILLSVPPLLVMAMIITNDYHHLMWTGFRGDQTIVPLPGLGNRILLGYAFVLGVVNLVVLIRLAIRSPQHRWPVALMVFGQITGRGVFLLDYAFGGSLRPEESILVVLGVLLSMYAIALFRFHVFDPVTAARTAVLEQMREGMLVLDLEGKIVDLNPAAARILGNSAVNLKGQAVTGKLPDLNLSGSASKTGSIPAEISLGSGKANRYYSLNLTSLIDKHNQALGTLLLLREITEEKKAQALVIEQQQVVATLQERERLARELHDSAGQVLGYVNLQAQTIQKWIQAGNYEKAESLLVRLAEAAREAHADVRESILSLKIASAKEWVFLPTLQRYLNEFQTHYNIQTELNTGDGLREDLFEPVTEVQLLRVIQEALTNVRKHSGASKVQVNINRDDRRGYITIADNGTGFDPTRLNPDGRAHFGLNFMKERMALVGGSVNINSQPGSGTIVKLDAPVRGELE